MRTANYNNNEVEVLNYNIKFSETNSPIFEEREDDFYYELSSEEVERLRKSEQQIKEGKTISSDQLFKKLRAKYAN